MNEPGPPPMTPRRRRRPSLGIALFMGMLLLSWTLLLRNLGRNLVPCLRRRARADGGDPLLVGVVEDRQAAVGIEATAIGEKALGLVAVGGAIGCQHPLVSGGKLAKSLALRQIGAAENAVNSRRLDPAPHAHDIDLEHGEVRGLLADGVAGNDGDAIGLRQALQPRGYVDRIAE